MLLLAPLLRMPMLIVCRARIRAHTHVRTARVVRVRLDALIIARQRECRGSE